MNAPCFRIGHTPTNRRDRIRAFPLCVPLANQIFESQIATRLRQLVRRELVKLAQLCSQGVSQKWEFNEWHHGVTGRPMGKSHQAWSAASFIRACHDLHLDPRSIDRM